MPERAGTATHTVLLLVCVLTVLPFWWMFSTSLKPPNEVFDLNPWPSTPTVENYRLMWAAIPMAATLVNTLLNAVLVMIGQGVIAIIAAYAFARWRFFGMGPLFMLFIGTWLVPFQVTMLPTTYCSRGSGGSTRCPRWWCRTSGAPSPWCCCASS